MVTFVEFFQRLEYYGMTDALLPFLLIFVVVFAILQKSKILGDGRKNFNVVVAMVLALIVVIPHITGSYPPGADVVEIINSAIPNVSVILIAIIMFLLIVGLLGGEITWLGTSLSGWIAVIAAVVVLLIFGYAAGWWGTPYWSNTWWLGWLGDPDTVAIVIIILVFAVLIWFITKEPKQEKEQVRGFTKGMENLGKMFSGGK
ncbi:hypothetical protein JXB02_02665 [Candidatus Woesearchaeota archaeon]|nr:hypothetical protein [Candidatus Woesearchaeota archaeon]